MFLPTWDIVFKKKPRIDERTIGNDYLEYIVLEDEYKYLDEIEAKFEPIMKEYRKIGKDIDLKLKEVERRVKTIASQSDKIKGGVENEIGMRTIYSTLIKSKMDTLKERGGLIKTIEELKLKISKESGGGGNSNDMGVTNGSITAKAMAFKHRERNTSVNKSLYDAPTVARQIDSSEDIPIEREIKTVEREDYPGEDGPDIKYKKTGGIDYAYGARTMRMNRQCSADGSITPTKNVLYYDDTNGKYWVGIEDNNGESVDGQYRPLEYFKNASIDLRAMRAEDDTGTTYTIKIKDSKYMPEVYQKAWKEIE